VKTRESYVTYGSTWFEIMSCCNSPVRSRECGGWIATHLITRDCLLVRAIVTELYGAAEMEWLNGSAR